MMTDPLSTADEHAPATGSNADEAARQAEARALAAAPDRRSALDPLKRHPEALLIPALAVVLLFSWQYAVRIFGVSELLIPKPGDVFEAFKDDVTNTRFWKHAWVTLKEAFFGFGIAVAAGLAIGTMVSLGGQVAERTVTPFIVAFQSIPKVALGPLFVLWFGYGITSKVVLAATVAFFPIVVNAIEGFRSADPTEVEMMRLFNGTKFAIFRKVRFKAALPFIFAGLHIAFVFALLGAVVGEFVNASEGLGYLIVSANYAIDIPGMFSVLIVLSVIGMLGDMLIGIIERRVVFWVR